MYDPKMTHVHPVKVDGERHLTDAVSIIVTMATLCGRTVSLEDIRHGPSQSRGLPLCIACDQIDLARQPDRHLRILRENR